jgi:NAD(P)-dependent dehydrogenase (short-subunit alcohol dehydrogenase family)
MDVKDKVVVVTGGASGIGLALCNRFAHEGAHVVLSDLKQDACERFAEPIGALPVAADVGMASSWTPGLRGTPGGAGIPSRRHRRHSKSGAGV